MLQNVFTVAISSDFFSAFAALPRPQQTKVSRFVEKFRENPAGPGINYERIEQARDKNLRSVRIDDAYRGIVLRPEKGNVYVLLWVDHHDEAYRWAANKVYPVNPESGSLQVVDVTVAAASAPATDRSTAPGLFAEARERNLLRLGVPELYLPRVLAVADDAGLDALAPELPEEASEALYMLAVGYSFQEVVAEQEKTAARPVDATDFAAALESPDSQRRFYVVEDERELAAMLNAPLEQWRVFLHPSQRRLVERDWNGPVRVLGGAGTGKTVAALHRTKWLAENRFTGVNDRILFTTFTRNLAADIREDLGNICAPETMSRIEVVNLDKWVQDVLRRNRFELRILFPGDTQRFWDQAMAVAPAAPALSLPFYREEWAQVVQPLGVDSADAYAKVSLRRGTTLNRQQRAAIWPVFEEYRTLLAEAGAIEIDGAVRDARLLLERQGEVLPYRAIVVDEAQDMGDEALRLIRRMIPEERSNDLFIVGDAHQRIYRRSVVLGRCGVNIRGRSRKLRINYRTTDETRRWAAAVVAGVPVDDLDEGIDDLKGYRSLIHGEPPEVRRFPSFAEEVAWVANWAKGLGAEMSEACLVTRTQAVLERFAEALNAAEVATYRVRRNEAEDRVAPGLRLATMHRVKGLTFGRIAIADANRGILPLEASLAEAADPASRREAEHRERRLLFVAATRARREVKVLVSSDPSPLLPAVVGP
jgi:superfamily I DNA/RNA helicase/mRNA-degrading endonuclease RelE of RelBE toxin-antitoxin system